MAMLCCLGAMSWQPLLGWADPLHYTFADLHFVLVTERNLSFDTRKLFPP